MNTLNELLVHPIFQRLGWTLVHSIWQGAAVAFLVAIALAMLGRRSSQARYVVACGGLLLMLGGLVATFFILPGPILRPDVVVPIDQPSVRATGVMLAPRLIAPMMQSQPPLTLGQRVEPLLPACAALWIIGIAVISIRHVGGWMRVQQLRKGATPLAGDPWDALMSRVREVLRVKRAVAIAESALVQVPSVIGYLKPIILLPACAMSGLSPAQLEGLIAHELAHVRRHDYLVNLLQIVIETLLFYHPAAWWLSKRIRQERENCCDDLAATVCGNRVAYVQALAAMEELRMVPGELVLAARGGSLLPRVRRLLGVQTPRQRGWSLTAAIVVVIVALVPLIVAQHKAKADENPSHVNPTSYPDFPTTSAIQPEDLDGKQPEYLLLPSDLVSVKLTDLVGPQVETVKQVRVSAQGEVNLPSNHKVKIAGMTTSGAEKAIQSAYTDMVAKLQVEVTVIEARGASVAVSGDLNQPGIYEIPKGGWRLRDAIQAAGGTSSTSPVVYVSRAAADPAQSEKRRTLQISFDKLKGGDENQNVVIRPGDDVYVPHPITQKAATTRRSAAVRPEDLVAEKSEYRIEPSDLVQVSIMELTGAGQETVKQERVSDKGEIPLPYIGRVKAAGMTDSELEKSIAKAYADNHLIANPQVAVSITEARGRTFSILGNVARPGQYVISQNDFRLLDALVVAGGLTDSPQVATIIRKDAREPDQTRYIQVPLKELTAANLKYNVVVRPKDMVIVGTDGKVPANLVGMAPEFISAASPTTAPAAVSGRAEAQVPELIRRSRSAVNEGKYTEAFAILNQILTLDPNNEYATAVRSLVEDRVLKRSQTTAFPATNELPPASDLKTVLARQVPEVNFSAVALGDVLDFFRDITSANIVVDWRALSTAGVTKDSPVTVRVRDVSFDKALQLVLDSVSGAQAKLVYAVDDNVIQIRLAATSAPASPNAPATNDAAALRNSDPTVRELANVQTQLQLHLDQLKGQGFGDNHKLVQQAKSELDLVTRQLAAAEAASAKPPTSAPTQDPKMKALLERQLPEVNLSAVPLGDVIDFLRDITSANIFVNWNALESAGIKKDTPVTLRLNNVPFGKVLDVLLDSVSDTRKLTYTVDQGVISISTAPVENAAISASSLEDRNYLLRLQREQAKVQLQQLQARGNGETNPTVIALRTRIESLSKELQLPNSAPAPTQPLYKAVRIVLGPEKMTLEGKETTWEKAKEELAKLANRGELVLEVAVASDQMTLKQHNEAVSRGMLLANELKFKYVSDVGVHPLGSKGGQTGTEEMGSPPATNGLKSSAPTTQTSAKVLKVPSEAMGPGEFFIDGHVVRPGVYSLTGRQGVRFLTAIEMAGGPDKDVAQLRITRKVPGKPDDVFRISTDGLDDPQKNGFVYVGDTILVGSETLAPTTAPATTRH